MEPRPPTLGAQSLSHWTTREVPTLASLILLKNPTPLVPFSHPLPPLLLGIQGTSYCFQAMLEVTGGAV